MEKQYIGARYVPILDGAWDIRKSYQALTIVQAYNNSYTSKKPVPPGIDITNEEYWVITGNFNGQVEEYRQQVEQMQTDVAEVVEEIEKTINVFETVDELKKAPNLKAGQKAMTTGYHVKNDGGGCFYIISDTDDGYSIPIDNGLFAKILIMTEEISPEVFGAYGDAVTDDTLPLQKCINFATERNMTAKLRGRYVVSAALELKTGAKIEGVGGNSTNYDTTGAADFSHIKSGIICKGGVGALKITERQYNIHLSNFAIVGSSYENGSVAIYCDRLRASNFENIDVAWFGTGLFLGVDGAEISDDNTMYNTFIGCRIIRCRTCYKLDGKATSGGFSGNTCHNTFMGCSADCMDSGWVLGDCDNNGIFDAYIFQRTGEWAMQIEEGARSNFIYHFQGRIINKSSGTNMVFGYDRENGQKVPYSLQGAGNLRFLTSDGILAIQNGNKTRCFSIGAPNLGDIGAGAGSIYLNEEVTPGGYLGKIAMSEGIWTDFLKLPE